MEIKNIWPEHGGNSSQISSHHNYAVANELQVIIGQYITYSVVNTPYKSPQNDEICHTNSAKRRKGEVQEYTTTSNVHKGEVTQGGTCHKASILSKLVGFIKVHVRYSPKDATAILKGYQTSMMEMEDGAHIINKVVKIFDLVKKAWNLRFHLKVDTLHNNSLNSIFKSLVKENHYDGNQHELWTLTN